MMQIALRVVERFAKLLEILAKSWGGDYANGLEDPGKFLG